MFAKYRLESIVVPVSGGGDKNILIHPNYTNAFNRQVRGESIQWLARDTYYDLAVVKISPIMVIPDFKESDIKTICLPDNTSTFGENEDVMTATMHGSGRTGMDEIRAPKSLQITYR